MSRLGLAFRTLEGYRHRACQTMPPVGEGSWNREYRDPCLGLLPRHAHSEETEEFDLSES